MPQTGPQVARVKTYDKVRTQWGMVISGLIQMHPGMRSKSIVTWPQTKVRKINHAKKIRRATKKVCHYVAVTMPRVIKTKGHFDEIDIKHASLLPSGIPRVFDLLVCPGKWEYDSKSRGICSPSMTLRLGTQALILVWEIGIWQTLGGGVTQGRGYLGKCESFKLIGTQVKKN